MRLAQWRLLAVSLFCRDAYAVGAFYHRQNNKTTRESYHSCRILHSIIGKHDIDAGIHLAEFCIEKQI